jgi:hypothetical protein
MMDLGSGKRGALDEVIGLSDKQGGMKRVKQRYPYKLSFDAPSIGFS